MSGNAATALVLGTIGVVAVIALALGLAGGRIPPRESTVTFWTWLAPSTAPIFAAPASGRVTGGKQTIITAGPMVSF